jgi:hypothetical protein
MLPAADVDVQQASRPVVHLHARPCLVKTLVVVVVGLLTAWL